MPDKKKEAFVDFFSVPFVCFTFIRCAVLSVMKLKTLQCKKRKYKVKGKNTLQALSRIVAYYNANILSDEYFFLSMTDFRLKYA